MRLDPKKGNIMMSVDVLKMTMNAPNHSLITPSFDRFVPDEVRTVRAVGEEVYTPTNGHGGGPIRGTNSLEGTVKSADFNCVVGRAKGLYSVQIRPFGALWSPERSKSSRGASNLNTPPGRA